MPPVPEADAEILEAGIGTSGIVAGEEFVARDVVAEIGQGVAVEQGFFAREEVREVDIERAVLRLLPVEEARSPGLPADVRTVEIAVDEGE